MKIQTAFVFASALLLFVEARIGSAQVAPIAATGWNYDIVLNNPAPYNATVTGTMDGGLGITVEGWTWVQQGDYTNVDGNTQAYLGLTPGTHSSLTGRGTFAFQDFSGLNAIGLDGANSSATLTLTNPASYKSIALYGASGYGSKTIDVFLDFSDSSTTHLVVENGTGIGTDWFNSNADKALVVGARASNKSEEGYTRLFYEENLVIGINESYFTLSPADQAKTLTSISFETFAGDRTAIFAISGESTSALAAADFNSSGQVNADDLALWKTGYGTPTSAGRTNGDADADGDVDGADFLVWQRQYTAPGAAASVTAVPEPVALGMAIIPLAILAYTSRSVRTNPVRG